MTDLKSVKSLVDYGIDQKLSFRERLRVSLRRFALMFSGTRVADIFGVPKEVQAARKAVSGGPGNGFEWAQLTDPDAYLKDFENPAMNPVVAFHEALKANGDSSKCSEINPWKGKKLKVSEAWVFTGKYDKRGKLLRDPRVKESLGDLWPRDHRIIAVEGTEAYQALFERALKEQSILPEKIQRAKEVHELKLALYEKFREDGFTTGVNFFPGTQPDPNQYTEYAPLLGGPFFKQQYYYDRLKGLAYAFEAWNHNPVAKAIIRIMCQYALGRSFEMRFKDDAQKDIWERYDRKYKITDKVCNFWGIEEELYGDVMIDKETFESIDPSTVWDIITDPDRVSDEYYFYQSYPTAYQMYTGYTVPGEPGAEKQAASEYIIRQLPAYRVLHRKLNCVSNEKFGRNSLFSILGWLKRIKDLYNAQVVREWIYSCFIWDVEVKGGPADVQAYINNNPSIPLTGSRNVHNDAIKIAPMPAVQSSGSHGGTGIGEEILCFIAVACQIPKEFLNVISQGGGSRAQALTAAEPFTKSIEAKQARWESILHEIWETICLKEGIDYEENDLEVLFPSVTKDTTTETMQNISLAEQNGWIDHQTAAEMGAKELNITSYDFDQVQAKIKKLQRAGITPTMPGGRFGDTNGMNGSSPEENPNAGSEIHGKGKQQLTRNLKTL